MNAIKLFRNKRTNCLG